MYGSDADKTALFELENLVRSVQNFSHSSLMVACRLGYFELEKAYEFNDAGTNSEAVRASITRLRNIATKLQLKLHM